MGQLADTAKKNSNFFKIEKGETAIVTFLSYRIVPSTMDPTKETVQYKFKTPHGDKFWTNGNSRIMMFFDTLKGGEKINITREKWLNKDGSEDTSKSTYSVNLVEDFHADIHNGTDDQNTTKTPGVISDPQEIDWQP